MTEFLVSGTVITDEGDSFHVGYWTIANTREEALKIRVIMEEKLGEPGTKFIPDPLPPNCWREVIKKIKEPESK